MTTILRRLLSWSDSPWVIAVIATLACVPSIAPAEAVKTFDGHWQTTVSCKNARDALGYSYRFIGDVKDGAYSGLHGTEGEPGYLRIEGKIDGDGSGKFYAKGKTNSPEFVPGRSVKPGTDYGYAIDVHFKGREGTGTRIEGRPCDFKFEKR